MNEVSNLIKAIINSEEEFAKHWNAFSVIFGFDSDGISDNSYGYLYSSTGFRAVAPAPWDVEKEMAAYLRTVYGDGPGPIKMLLQFDRASGQFNVEFEDKNPKRWAVTPADIHGYIDSLRPKFAP
ncbi:MAG: hypothetical protein ACRCZF_21510 [Gemmataceae bacterium]